MRAKTHPVRLDPQITAAAKTVAPQMSRSTAEQLSHWARIGREIELSPEISIQELRRVLNGSADYDTLPAQAQAVVRAAWAERMESLRRALRLDEEFKARGADYAELDENGEIAVRTSVATGHTTA